MTEQPDPYRCSVCGKPWVIRWLATMCCSPERRRRLEQQQ